MDGGAGADRVELEIRQPLQDRKLGRVGGDDRVHLLRCHRRDLGSRVVTEIDEDHLIQIRPLAPVILPRLQHRALADLVFHHLEWAGAVHADAELAALGRVGHEEGIVKEVLRHRELRHAQVQADGEVVDLLDRVGVPELGRHLRLAGGVLLVGRNVDGHVALHQAQDRGAGLRVEHALDVPDHLVGGEHAALPPLHVLPDLQGPGLEVSARLPALQQHRARDVVGAGVGQVLDHLAGEVAGRHVAGAMKMRGLADARAETKRAALLWRALGQRRRDRRSPVDLAGEGVSGRRADAEQRRRPQELAPVAFAVGKQRLQFRNVWVLTIPGHVGLSPDSDNRERPTPGRPLRSDRKSVVRHRLRKWIKHDA